jgi:hypothetical protein
MDIDPHNLGEPVFKGDQVVTYSDLLAIMEGFAYRYNHARWWEFMKKREFKYGVMVTNSIMKWLDDGKKVVTL